MANHSANRPSFSPVKKWAAALNVLASCLALLALVAMFNYLVIFDCNGKKRIVRAKELSDYDLQGIFTGKQVKRTAFKGEQFFTSAILRVTDPKPFKSYCLHGHGEHDLASEDEATGYLKFTR